MINDPYKVLGVSESASQEEIKSAYRKMAKMYHPDLHPNDPKATEKMNEINEAYDMLSHPEKYAKRRAEEAQRQSYQSYGYNPFGTNNGQNSNGYQGAGGWYTEFNGFDFEDFFGFGRSTRSSSGNINPTVMDGDSDSVKAAINNINRGYYQEAFRILMQIPHTGRNARWYYLNAVTLYGYGDVSQAIEYIQKAVQMEPYNETYKDLYSRFTQEGRTYYRSNPIVFNPFRTIGKIILFFFLLRIFFGFLSLFLGFGMMPM